MKNAAYTAAENYNNTLKEARAMSVNEIERVLHSMRHAMHSWAVDAYEQGLKEKRSNISVHPFVSTPGNILCGSCGKSRSNEAHDYKER